MSTVDLDTVRQHVEILKMVKQKKSALAELEKNSRAAIEDAMGGHDVGMLDGIPVIHWTSYKTNRFDQSAFAEDHPDLLEQYKAMKEARKFEIL